MIPNIIRTSGGILDVSTLSFVSDYMTKEAFDLLLHDKSESAGIGGIMIRFHTGTAVMVNCTKEEAKNTQNYFISYNMHLGSFSESQRITVVAPIEPKVAH